VKRVTTSYQPSPFSSIETTSALPRTLESTGTGPGKRILLALYELSGGPYQARRRQNNPKVSLDSRRMGQFPSIKAKRLLATLERKPLGYRVARQTGSHRRLEAPGRPALAFAFNDNATIPSGLVRKILIKDIGLAEDEARKLL